MHAGLEGRQPHEHPDDDVGPDRPDPQPPHPDHQEQQPERDRERDAGRGRRCRRRRSPGSRRCRRRSRASAGTAGRATGSGGRADRARRPRTRCRSPSGSPSPELPAPPPTTSDVDRRPARPCRRCAATIGSAAVFGSRRSPWTSSYLISSPTTKKKITIRASLTQCCSDSSSRQRPDVEREGGVPEVVVRRRPTASSPRPARPRRPPAAPRSPRPRPGGTRAPAGPPAGPACGRSRSRPGRAARRVSLLREGRGCQS